MTNKFGVIENCNRCDTKAIKLISKRTGNGYFVTLTTEGNVGELAPGVVNNFHQCNPTAVAAKRAAQQATAPTTSFANFAQLFRTAIEKGAKRLAVAFGEDVAHIELKYSPKGVIYVTDGGEYMANKYYGAISIVDGSFRVGRDYRAEVGLLLNLFNESPAEALGKYGRATGTCCFCSKKLTDGGSIQHGYGPTCAKKFGLPWASKGVATLMAA